MLHGSLVGSAWFESLPLGYWRGIFGGRKHALSDLGSEPAADEALHAGGLQLLWPECWHSCPDGISVHAKNANILATVTRRRHEKRCLARRAAAAATVQPAFSELLLKAVDLHKVCRDLLLAKARRRCRPRRWATC